MDIDHSSLSPEDISELRRIFDDEVQRARAQLQNNPEYQERVEELIRAGLLKMRREITDRLH